MYEMYEWLIAGFASGVGLIIAWSQTRRPPWLRVAFLCAGRGGAVGRNVRNVRMAYRRFCVWGRLDNRLVPNPSSPVAQSRLSVRRDRPGRRQSFGGRSPTLVRGAKDIWRCYSIPAYGLGLFCRCTRVSVSDLYTIDATCRRCLRVAWSQSGNDTRRNTNARLLGKSTATVWNVYSVFP